MILPFAYFVKKKNLHINKISTVHLHYTTIGCIICMGCDFSMDLMQKLEILTDSAKYDVACTSSGVSRKNTAGLGSAASAGICHAWSADGRCISLLKVLFTNYCIYDCKYCINRTSNDVPRASFTPEELAELTIEFYRRNYIEGLFLSSGVIKSPDYTTGLMIKALRLLRHTYNFHGYIHAKAIPGTSSAQLHELGLLADRMSVNIELPSEKSLALLAPDKNKSDIFAPMKYIKNTMEESHGELVKYNHTPAFAPAGHSTQMIVGASDEPDRQIISLTEGLYKKYSLKRVFFSAYIPVAVHSLLPSIDTKPPLLREHRLYQADWLLRFYGFSAEELLTENEPNFNPFLDPKCNWAIQHLEQFPVDLATAPYETILRVPGIGVTCAKRILTARRNGSLSFTLLKKLGVVLKRAQYFIICDEKPSYLSSLTRESTVRALIDPNSFQFDFEQTSFLDLPEKPHMEEVIQCLTRRI